MFRIYVVYKCRTGKGKEFVTRVIESGIADAIRSEEGCIKYDYYLMSENTDEVLLVEFWGSKNHQKVHMTQPHMADLRKISEECVEDTTIGQFEISKL